MEILVYITVGFLILRIAIAFINSITLSGLEFGWMNEEDLISILIPARNEENNILNILEDISLQEYQHIEILVLNDSSTDRTAEIVRAFSLTDSRCQLMEGEALPQEWLGKNWACHQLAKHAKGDYFIFIDADVRINGPLFSTALCKLKENQLSLLSLFPGQDMKTIGEWLVVPLMHYLLLSLLPLRFIEWFKHPSLAAANGQFMLFNGGHYRNKWWHQQVKDKVTEDIEIMKSVKRAGLKGAAMLENNFIRCRMYQGFYEGVNGFKKNLLAGFGGNMLSLLTYLYLTIFSYAFLFFAGYWEIAMVVLLLIIFLRSLISAMADQNPLWNVLLHILQMAVMLYIAALSVAGKFSGTIKWKGRTIKG